jgi:hypothetical protein
MQFLCFVVCTTSVQTTGFLGVKKGFCGTAVSILFGNVIEKEIGSTPSADSSCGISQSVYSLPDGKQRVTHASPPGAEPDLLSARGASHYSFRASSEGLRWR